MHWKNWLAHSEDISVNISHCTIFLQVIQSSILSFGKLGANNPQAQDRGYPDKGEGGEGQAKAVGGDLHDAEEEDEKHSEDHQQLGEARSQCWILSCFWVICCLVLYTICVARSQTIFWWASRWTEVFVFESFWVARWISLNEASIPLWQDHILLWLYNLHFGSSPKRSKIQGSLRLEVQHVHLDLLFRVVRYVIWPFRGVRVQKVISGNVQNVHKVVLTVPITKKITI